MITPDQKWTHNSRVTDIVLYFFLFLICLVLYYPSLSAGFILDDWYVVYQNPLIKQPALYPKIFGTDFFSSSVSASQAALHYYRPLALFSFIGDYQIWGLQAFGYRFNNLFFHFLNCFLLYRLLKELFKNQKIAAFTSLIFCVLPTHEWIVNTIVCRSDLLQLFFLLLSLLGLLDFLKRGATLRFYLSLAFYLLSILSKETAVVYALLPALLCRFLGKDLKETIKICYPFFIISLVYILGRMIIFPITEKPLGTFLTFQQWGIWLGNIVEYVPRLIFPWSLQAVFKESVWEKIVLRIAGAGILAGAGYFLKKKSFSFTREFLFGLSWIIVGFVPFLVLFQIIDRLGPYISEYLLYCCSVGFAMILSIVILQWRPAISNILLICLVGFYGSVVIANNSYWKSEKEVLTRVNSLGEQYRYIAGMQLLMKYNDNEEEINKMIVRTKNPSPKSSWVRRKASLYRSRNDYPQAVTYFEEAIRLDPFNTEAFNELAVTHLNMGHIQEGVAWLKKSLSAQKENPQAYRLLGIVSYQREDYHFAVDYLQKAAFYDPNNIESLRYLAMSYYFSKNKGGYDSTVNLIVKQNAVTADVIGFVAGELYRHGYLKEADDLLSNSKRLLVK